VLRKPPLIDAHNMISVPSPEDHVTPGKKNGGNMASPKVRVPGIGRIAVFRDPEGNEFRQPKTEPPG
jgi:predicted enzyme related to lactoylglutathione lyase